MAMAMAMAMPPACHPACLPIEVETEKKKYRKVPCMLCNVSKRPCDPISFDPDRLVFSPQGSPTPIQSGPIQSKRENKSQEMPQPDRNSQIATAPSLRASLTYPVFCERNRKGIVHKAKNFLEGIRAYGDMVARWKCGEDASSAPLERFGCIVQYKVMIAKFSRECRVKTPGRQ